MKEKSEIKHQVEKGHLKIIPNITLNAALKIYKFRKNNRNSGDNPWEGNVSYLYIPQINMKFIDISQGDFLHSEMLVAMQAVCHLPNSPYNQAMIADVKRRVREDINILKRKYNALSLKEKEDLKKEIKQNETDLIEEVEKDLEKSAQQLFISKNILSCKSIKDRDKVLNYFYQNVIYEPTITTERCPCNACKKTFNTVAQQDSKPLIFMYLVTMQGKSRQQVAKELEGQYKLCEKLHLLREESKKIEYKKEDKKEFKDYIDQKLIVIAKIKDFIKQLDEQPAFKEIIIKEEYKAELQSLKRLKEHSENITKNFTLSSDKDIIKNNLRLILKLYHHQELQEHVNICLSQIEDVPVITNVWKQKNDTGITEKYTIVKSSLEKLLLLLGELIAQKENEYSKQLHLANISLEQIYQPLTSSLEKNPNENLTSSQPPTENKEVPPDSLIKHQKEIKDNLNAQKSETDAQTNKLSLS